MGKFYFGHLSYNGAHFNGWQKQQVGIPTIQSFLEEKLQDIFPRENQKVFASSRTDAKVSAFAQPIKVLLPRMKGEITLMNELNEVLKPHVKLITLSRINPSFKITHFVCSKTYLYFFSYSFKKDFPFVLKISEACLLEGMKEAALAFVGKHNFKNYQYRSDVKGSFDREIYACEIIKANLLFRNMDDDIYVLRINGSGFLKQMVRLIFGTILRYSSGSISKKDIIKRFGTK